MPTLIGVIGGLIVGGVVAFVPAGLKGLFGKKPVISSPSDVRLSPEPAQVINNESIIIDEHINSPVIGLPGEKSESINIPVKNGDADNVDSSLVSNSFNLKLKETENDLEFEATDDSLPYDPPFIKKGSSIPTDNIILIDNTNGNNKKLFNAGERSVATKISTGSIPTDFFKTNYKQVEERHNDDQQNSEIIIPSVRVGGNKK